ncbi:MAG: hypothetical protein ACKPKO_64095 [Candidatus Fonsibacter sp.]
MWPYTRKKNFRNINLHCLRNMLVCESKNRKKNIKNINSII